MPSIQARSPQPNCGASIAEHDPSGGVPLAVARDIDTGYLIYIVLAANSCAGL